MSLVATIDGRHLRNIAVATTKYWECWYWSFSQNCHGKGGGKGLASFLEVPLWKPNLLSGRIHKTCPGGLCKVCAAFHGWWDMNNDQESVLLWNCKSPQSIKIGRWPLSSSSTTAAVVLPVKISNKQTARSSIATALHAAHRPGLLLFSLELSHVAR